MILLTLFSFLFHIASNLNNFISYFLPATENPNNIIPTNPNTPMMSLSYKDY